MPWAYYDPDTSSWKTSQLSFLDDPASTSFSGALPASGSMRSGLVYERRTSVHPTAGSGGSALLKTPTSQLAVNGGSQHPDKRKAGGHGPTLADEVEHLLPTPTTDPATGNGHARNLSREAQLLPTPTATPYGNNQSASPGAAVRPSLDVLAPTLLPTPSAADGLGGHLSRSGDRSAELLLAGVARSLGAPMPLPSADGNAPSDDLHLFRLSLDGTDNPG
jgi:hypothetical protein